MRYNVYIQIFDTLFCLGPFPILCCLFFTPVFLTCLSSSVTSSIEENVIVNPQAYLVFIPIPVTYRFGQCTSPSYSDDCLIH